MGSRHISELLLRSASRVYISHPSPPSIACRRLPSSPSWLLPSTPQRSLNTSPPSLSAQPQPQPKEDPESNTATTDAIDDLFRGTGFSSRETPPRRPLSRQHTPTSSDELRAARHMFGSQFSKPGSSSLRRKPLDFDDMVVPDDIPADTPAQTPAIPEEDIVYPRLNPAYGRTVDLDPSKGRDIVRGISMLGSLMARNRVRSDFTKQRYHERAGLKRKRLKSERWRARFKIGFRNVVGRVSELTRKGW